MLKLTPKSSGFTFAVKVVPGASRSRIAGPYGEGIKVTVTAAPERGAANAAALALLADTLQLPRSSLSIASGLTNARKEVLVVGLDAETIAQRLTVK